MSKHTRDIQLRNGSVVLWSRRNGDQVSVLCGNCRQERLINFRRATEKDFSGYCFNCTRLQMHAHSKDETLSNSSIIFWTQRNNQREVRVKCSMCGQTRMMRTARVAGSSDFSGYCANCARAGKNSVHWKGGRSKHPTGYIKIRLTPDHPLFSMADKHRLVSEHRLLLAEKIGRPLLDHEVVHHKNGIKDDNRIENLELLERRLHHNAFSQEHPNENQLWQSIVSLVKVLLRK